MSAPTIHRFWTTTTSGTSSYSRYVDYVEKSDYDELQAKLTEAESVNKVALEAMKEAQRVSHKVVGLKLKVLNNAIKELEALK